MMRYRELNQLGDFSRDVSVVVDFIGQEEYRRSLKAIGDALSAKGFVTPFDDAYFALELDLFNLEMLREQCAGNFKSLPSQCHAGVDFLLGLGQTIPVLSTEAKTILLGRLRKGLQEGLWPLQHELRVAANLSALGWDIHFHDFEDAGGYDFLVAQNGITFEVEAKAVSAFTGWPIKPENINKLLVEIKEHFVWEDASTIPLLGLKLSSSLVPDRTRLQQLVSTLSKVAQTQEELSLSDAHVRFIGAIPRLTPDKLQKATYRHAQMTKKIVLFSTTDPKIVLELDSHRPIQLERKIIRTISETAREQFSRLKPGVIWTHINFIPNEVFTSLSSSQGGNACFLDRIAGSALLSEKRNHLSQLVFSGGSFLDKTASTARSSYGRTLYDSPVCRFGKNVIFQGGRRKPSLALGTA